MAEVYWIDRDEPNATITYSTTNPTNQDVTATVTFDKENVTITNNGGKNTYTFTENGEFEFEFVGPAGNTGIVIATVDWIDKTLPKATITYDKSEPTNQEVTASIAFDKENVTITNNNGKNAYTFTENGQFEFEFVGPAGNAGTAIANVTWIDKEAPVAEIRYSTESATNQEVIATITFNEEDVTVEGGNTHTFTENGEYIFKYSDKAGNQGAKLAKVTWIDKTLPVATISYDINELTNQDVTATVTFDKENVTITNNDGKNTYTFTENGQFEFEFIGPSGNAGVAVASVNWIDKVAPIAEIEYSIDKLTNQDVVATVVNPSEEITFIESDGTHTFTENGEYVFEFIDSAGNRGTVKAEVLWIDKIVPVATITYSTETETMDPVTATITFDKENVKITNNEENNTYLFTENGEFTFEFIDLAGNIGTAIANVNWIQNDLPQEPSITSDSYNIKENIISRISAQTTVTTFKEKVTANKEIRIIDEQGNILNDDAILATGMKLKLDENTEYTLVITGDINKDGRISITDLAKLKLHIIEKDVLQDYRYLAADINGDDRVSITDLAKLKKLIIGIE